MPNAKLINTVPLLLAAITFFAHEVGAQQIVGSDRHASILCVDGAVFSWGENIDGLLGDGTLTEHQGAVRSKVSGVTSLMSKYNGVVAVDERGDVFVWSGVERNQFGMPAWNWIEPLPLKVEHVSGVRKAVAGTANGYYLLRTDRLKVSGHNGFGQYGNGTRERIDTGSTEVALDSIVDVFCSIGTVFAVRADGTVWAWGSNIVNQIDSADTQFYAEPRLFLRTSGVVATLGTSGGLPARMGSMRIVMVDGDVWVWGENEKNQLGVANATRVIAPVKLSFPKKVIAIAGGYEHTVVLLEDRTVWTWGDNEYGQLGNPYYPNTVEPVPAIGLSDVVAIGSGSYSSYAILRDGSLHGWGDNTYRQLNRDDAPRQYTAVPLPVPCTLVTGVAVSEETSAPRCSPSPIHDVVTIPILAGTSRVEIYSIEGRPVKAVHPSASDTTVRIDLSTEAPGLYAIVRTRGNVTATEMVIKY